MPELPDHIKQTFYKVMSKQMPIEAFEDWVYASKELERVLAADDYLELVSLNYKKAAVRYDLFNLLQRFVGAGNYEKWKLIGLLNRAKVHDRNLPGILEQFYHLYCDGYSFLNTLGLGFGLSMCVLPKPFKVEHWRELPKDELTKLIQNLPQLIINYEVDLVLRWLDEDAIILTGDLDQFNHYKYVDNRNDAEKVRCVQYGF
jgi:hypothetical protein